MSDDDRDIELRKLESERRIAEIESVIAQYRVGSIGLAQFITQLAQAVKKLAKIWGGTAGD
jgi:uncharacterized protein YbgA (DUF1722 family)